MIHGFGGSIREVKPLVEALEAQGIPAKCPALKGHTGNKKDLATVTWKDWIASAEEEFKCMAEECEQVFICGFSMGGLIGIQLAARYQFAGLITINTPIYYLDFRKIISNILFDLRSHDYGNIRRYLKPSNRLPVRALWNFRCLLRHTKSLIPSISIPMLIAQAIDDDVVHHRSAGYIYTHAAAAPRQVTTYVRGGHVILLSDAAHAVIRDVMQFLEGKPI